MGKARSRRTMMNRKSRNKRGGLFGLCLNCSPEKKLFKEKKKIGGREGCKYIVELVNETPDKAPFLFQELNEFDKDFMRECIVDGLVNDAISENQIRDLSSIYTNSTAGILLEVSQRREDAILNTSVQHLPVQETPKSMPVYNKRDRVMRVDALPKSGFFIPNKQTSKQTSSGGKSRRRHRHRRTLHKLRKSRKVRKTKCRRK